MNGCLGRGRRGQPSPSAGMPSISLIFGSGSRVWLGWKDGSHPAQRSAPWISPCKCAPWLGQPQFYRQRLPARMEGPLATGILASSMGSHGVKHLGCSEPLDQAVTPVRCFLGVQGWPHGRNWQETPQTPPLPHPKPAKSLANPPKPPETFPLPIF